MTTKTWTREQIDDILGGSDRAVERAIVRLYERQTSEEQASSSTLDSNARGFDAFSAKRGTYYARWVLSGRSLTGRHLDTARKIARKHSRQLVEIANEREAQRAAAIPES